MSSTARKPLVCVSGSQLPVTDWGYLVHAAGVRNTAALVRFSDCIPVVLPSLGDDLDVDAVIENVDGVLLTGARANVEPHHYDGPPFPADEPIDPERDKTALALTRAAVRANVPVFGICRGIQEINVALGGSLHYRLHMLDGKNDHRMPQHDDVTEEEIFTLKHTISITPGGILSRLVTESEVEVNSLHGQGIDRLGEGLVVEAVSPDGVIEAIALKDASTFVVGVQWHAEWKPEEHLLSRKLFEAFGEAVKQRSLNR